MLTNLLPFSNNSGGGRGQSGVADKMMADAVGTAVKLYPQGYLSPSQFGSEYNELQKQALEDQRQWSAEQAQKQMDFQERMSSTSYQRSKVDMQKAGLNPYLMMSGISGASTPQGIMATTSAQPVYSENDKLTRDIKNVDVITQLLSGVINSAVKIGIASMKG